MKIIWKERTLYPRPLIRENSKTQYEPKPNKHKARIYLHNFKPNAKKYYRFGEWEESGKRDSNSRPQPWQGCALPTELFPHLMTLFSQRASAQNRTRTCMPLDTRTWNVRVYQFRHLGIIVILIKNTMKTERKTRLELATPTLARLCSTNWAISANIRKVKRRRLELPRHDVTTPSK